MAFLNTAGTIKLDAILTDIGRRRLAQGNFEISSFVLGDDEIDYSLVGTSTDDTNVAKTPSLEALNANSATIIHGLEHYASDDILYIPQIKIISTTILAIACSQENKGLRPQLMALSIIQLKVII